jgi:hypothetical protein
MKLPFKIRRLKNIGMPIHQWAGSNSGIVVRFDSAVPQSEEPSCYRVAYVKLREDGQMFEEYADFQIGERDDLRRKKGEKVALLFRRALTIERCVGCKCEILPNQFAALFRGNLSHLRPSCVKALFSSEHLTPLYVTTLSFPPGSTFSMDFESSPECGDRISEIVQSLVGQDIDSSLADPTCQPGKDAIRMLRQRQAEQAEAYVKSLKKKAKP